MAVSSQPAFDDLELLAQVSRLWTQVDLDYVLREVVRLSAKAVGALRGSLILNRNQQISLANFVVSQDAFLPADSQDHLQDVATRGLAGWVLQHGVGTIVQDTTLDDRWYHRNGESSEIRSAVSVPFSFEDELLGVITLGHNEPDFFSEHHLRLMEIITNQVALAIHNARGFQQAQVHRKQLEAILHAIPDILLVLDRQGRVMLVSDAVAVLLAERPAQSIVGLNVNELVEIDSIFATLFEAITLHQDHQGDWSFETRSEQTNRDYFVHILARTHVAFTEPGYIIVMNDVTALRNLSRFKDHILSLVSHDLRTPLVVITGYADLLLDDTADYPLMQQYVAGILQASERMDTMLNNMMRVEKVRLNPSELHEPVNLETLVLTVLRDLRPLAAHKNIRLDMQFHGDSTPMIHGDSMLLQQAMENFVNNALKYTPDGGQVVVNAASSEDRFEFMVEDNGIGIHSDELPFVFQSYYRGNKTEMHRESGMGLGLSLVKNVINQHGGDVWVESEAGKGSRFGFWLPLTYDEETSSP